MYFKIIYSFLCRCADVLSSTLIATVLSVFKWRRNNNYLYHKYL